MEYSFRHSMRGRVRLHVPDLCRKPPFAETFLGWLKGQSGVRGARINYDCASLVLEYDPAHEPLLPAMLQRVKTMELAERKTFVGGATAAAPPQQPQAPEVSKRSPLALPTLSLMMAFST